MQKNPQETIFLRIFFQGLILACLVIAENWLEAEAKLTLNCFDFSAIISENGLNPKQNLKKFQLLRPNRRFIRVFPPENFHHPKLLVGNHQNTHMSLGWQQFFYPFYVHIGIFAAWAVSQVHAELKHGKTILEHIVPEFAGIFPVGLGLGWQVEHDEYPHDAICVKAISLHKIQLCKFQ
jgi:hypothetical protein